MIAGVSQRLHQTSERLELGDNQEPEILITSLLDAGDYPIEDFKWLYHQRWGVEEDYKCMKSRLEVERFTGKSVEAVLQDFHAKVFSKNLAAVLALEAQEVVDKTAEQRRHPHRVNRTMIISKLKGVLPKLLVDRTSDGHYWQRLVAMLARNTEPVRPGRSNIRKSGRGPKYSMNYKPVA